MITAQIKKLHFLTEKHSSTAYNLTQFNNEKMFCPKEAFITSSEAPKNRMERQSEILFEDLSVNGFM